MKIGTAIRHNVNDDQPNTLLKIAGTSGGESSKFGAVFVSRTHEFYRRHERRAGFIIENMHFQAIGENPGIERFGDGWRPGSNRSDCDSAGIALSSRAEASPASSKVATSISTRLPTCT